MAGLLLPAALVIALFAAVMTSMVRFSFSPGGSGGVLEPGFSLEHYERFLGSSFNLSYLTYSLWLSFYCTAITAVIGYLIAYFMYRSGPVVRQIVGTILIVQFFTAYVIRAYAVMLVLGKAGLLNQSLMALGVTREPIRILFTEPAVAIGLVLVSVPFMVFPILASLRAIPPNLEMAASALGAGGFRSFWTVVFPLSLPGVAAGIVVVFLFELTSYIVPGLLGGGYVDMIANLIYNKAMRSFEYSFAAAAAVVTLVVSGALVFVLNSVLGR
ncbi:MAG: putative spermidine/putrescine transport system permease protein, partial [Variibacter sp.]|nr:putative spermidine/putrescine transport system permease protein [Variibacter sp.]